MPFQKVIKHNYFKYEAISELLMVDKYLIDLHSR